MPTTRSQDNKRGVKRRRLNDGSAVESSFGGSDPMPLDEFDVLRNSQESEYFTCEDAMKLVKVFDIPADALKTTGYVAGQRVHFRVHHNKMQMYRSRSDCGATLVFDVKIRITYKNGTQELRDLKDVMLRRLRHETRGVPLSERWGIMFTIPVQNRNLISIIVSMKTIDDVVPPTIECSPVPAEKQMLIKNAVKGLEKAIRVDKDWFSNHSELCRNITQINDCGVNGAPRHFATVMDLAQIKELFLALSPFNKPLKSAFGWRGVSFAAMKLQVRNWHHRCEEFKNTIPNLHGLLTKRDIAPVVNPSRTTANRPPVPI